ncbi:hypothetical protein BCY91_12965 [Pelobium manganitolerans]|uniref:Uncharacterized protein n=1 Tax=Pelobium manganitolerans TaxID=1842495 RepID=A0A419SAQ1_9SPHI|nr:hypothetical protein [Pelobium manganitolerans]RKD19509.1 hypothetical protein BCY91_12965 [Pelobium manganitolerans]
MEEIKCYKNKESFESKILGFSILIIFALGFVYLDWIWIASFYSVFIIITFYRYLSGKRVLEVILSSNKITFYYLDKFKKKEESFFLDKVSAEKQRKSSFKFSEVYNLKIFVNSEFKLMLESQTEFSNTDLLEIYELINNYVPKR